MIEINQSRDLSLLRRIALQAQGLLKGQPFGHGMAGTQRTIKHLGYVQIDTISVVERAHHHVLYSRVPGFQSDMLEKLVRKGDVFEYWSHAAAYLPIHDFRFSLPYKQAIKKGQTHWYKNPDKKLMAELLERVRIDGPLQSRDLESKDSKGDGWWDWKPAKRALEQLYMEGDLMVSHREGFQKVYDLTERVLPTEVDKRLPDVNEFARHLVDQQLQCHGLVSLKGISYQRRNKDLSLAVKDLIEARLEQGHLEQVRLSEGEVFIIKAGALDQRLPRVNKQLLILSPFDNSVIQRDRLKALFDYDYKIECYVPAAKRQYGYFSLPLLYADEFIGRMDCKAHRNDKHLEIKYLHFEAHDFNEEKVIAAFIDAIQKFNHFQQCDTVSLIKIRPKHLLPGLQSALNYLA